MPSISLSLADALQPPPIPVSDHPTAMLRLLLECHQSDCTLLPTACTVLIVGCGKTKIQKTAITCALALALMGCTNLHLIQILSLLVISQIGIIGIILSFCKENVTMLNRCCKSGLLSGVLGE